ncbi:MAG: sulfur carrier protein ThiS adenylyltransferase ThiF [Bacteroidales bacterium]
MLFESLKRKTVGIAGCGGLGSNCAIALARIGIGKLIIADFDVIVQSNLNRQYFFIDQLGMYKVDALKTNIERVNTDVVVEKYCLKLSPDNVTQLFKNCDVIVEAFDLAEMKKMLIETVLSELPEKYIISGSGMAGWGNNNTIKTINYERLYICGDLTTEISENTPPLAPRVGIVANMQANQVVELLLNKKNH